VGKNNYRKFREATKSNYKKIVKISCAALSNEIVYFNNIGFNHILRKGKDIRPIADQIRRFKMLPFAAKIIQEGKLKDHRIISDSSEKVEFWTISYKFLNKNLQVTIIQKGNGQKNFLSISEAN
jgi:hypothetical protein